MNFLSGKMRRIAAWAEQAKCRAIHCDKRLQRSPIFSSSQHGGGYGNFERRRAERFCRNSNGGAVTCRKSFLRAAGADNNPFGRWWFAAEIPSALMNPSNGFRCRPASIVREL